MDTLTQETLSPLNSIKDHKEQAISLGLPSTYKALGQYKKSFRCADCGSTIAIDKYLNLINRTDIAYVLAWGIFCKVRWCPMCAWRKCRKLLAEMLSVFEQVEQRYKVAYVFLTLTTKNPTLSELRATTDHMSQAWKRLIQSKAWKHSVRGYLRAIEFMGDKTPDGEAHPHYHCLLVVPLSYFSNNYITQAEWVEMWQKALRVDYKPIVDIRGIRPKAKSKSKPTTPLNAQKPHNLNPALVSALVECLKYVAKPTKLAKLTTEQFTIFDSQAKGIRQINLGGLLKEIDPLPDTLDPSIWQFVEQEIYKWGGQDYELRERNPLLHLA